MKKSLVLLIVIMFISKTMIAQDSTSVTGTNTEALIDKYSAKIENAIITLADKLQQPAEHVYKVLTIQFYYKGLVTTILFIFTVIIMTILIITAGKMNWLIEREDYSTMTGKGITMLILMILIGILLLISFVQFLSGGFTQLVNPEYYAIKEIMSVIK